MKYTQIASPGSDMELLSLKAFNAIKSADAIFLEEEDNPDLLLFAPSDCLTFGNLNDVCDYLQSEKPDPNWHLVRVLAGDMQFDGNAYKELLFFTHYGFTTKIIPGISPITNLGAIHGFPLTQRGKTESFCVINCQENDTAAINRTIAQTAAATSSIVLLNAGNRTYELINKIAAYRDKCEQLLFVEQSRPQKALKTTLGQFQKSPATRIQRFDVIIIGPAAGGMHEKPEKQGWALAEVL